MERTLVVFKPDTVQRGLVGEILTRFERVGLKIVAAKMVWPNKEHYYHHYENIGKMVTRRGQKAFDVTLAMMGESPVLAMVLEGAEAVVVVRKMVGTTEPKSAVPGTIRGDYAHMGFAYADNLDIGIPNLVHASGDLDEAKVEIEHWFKSDELHEYSTVAQRHTQGRA